MKVNTLDLNNAGLDFRYLFDWNVLVISEDRDHRHDRGTALLLLRHHLRPTKRVDLHLRHRTHLLDCR